MNNSSKTLLCLTLFPGFFVEAMGLPFGRIVAVAVTGIFVLIYIFRYTRHKKSLSLNKLSILSIFFLLWAFFSVIQSVDINKSLMSFGEYLILFGILLYSINNSKELASLLPKLLIIGGFVLSVYSLLLNMAPQFLWVPKDGYQLVFSRFGSHNHLGDFLVLPMLICLYSVIKKNKRLYILPFLFFFPFLLFSYSRSAYLSFFLAGSIFLANTFWKSKYKKKLLVPIISFSFVVSIVLLFFFATVFESKYSSFLNPIHQILASNFGLRFKHFGANRPEYFSTALKSIQEKPFFGVGPGNFVYASAKYSSISNYRTHSSHNILLDIFVENGLPAFICFVAIIFLVLKSATNNFSIYSLLFFALLINFQTDYSFRIFSLYLIFFLIMGIIIGEDNKKAIM